MPQGTIRVHRDLEGKNSRTFKDYSKEVQTLINTKDKNHKRPERKLKQISTKHEFEC